MIASRAVEYAWDRHDSILYGLQTKMLFGFFALLSWFARTPLTILTRWSLPSPKTCLCFKVLLRPNLSFFVLRFTSLSSVVNVDSYCVCIPSVLSILPILHILLLETFVLV